MKQRVTKKYVRNLWKNIIGVGYADLQYLLRYLNADYYTDRVEGWGADFYIVDSDTIISTGYDYIETVKPSSELIGRYNQLGKKCCEKYYVGGTKLKEVLYKLLDRFAKEVFTEADKKENPPFAAMYHISYDSGIGVLDMNYGIDDYIVYQWFNSEGRSRKTKAKIRYTTDSRAYFISHKRRYYLDEFMKQ